MKAIASLPQLRIATAVFWLFLLFYVFSLQPSLSWGDGARLQREVISGGSFILTDLVDVEFADDPFPFARLGVAAWDHPLYIVLGHSLVQAGSWLAPGLDSLWLINLVSAFFAAAGLSVFFMLADSETGSRPAALLATIGLGLAHTYWWHATTPEVYSLHLFLLLFLIRTGLQWVETPTPRRFYLACLLFGLAIANHLMIFLMAPVLLVVLGWERKALAPLLKMPWRSYVIGLGALMLGASITLIQTLRLLRTFSASDLIGPILGSTFFQNLATIPLWLSVLLYIGYLAFQFAILGLPMGLMGLKRAHRQVGVFGKLVLVGFVVHALFGISYRVTDQFAFHLTSYVFFAFAIAFGLAHLLDQIDRKAVKIGLATFAVLTLLMPYTLTRLPAMLQSVGLDPAVIGVPQVGTGVRDGLDFYLNPNKRGDYGARTFGEQTLATLPPNSVIVAEWYADTDEYLILTYLQEAEGLRPDVQLLGWPFEDPFLFDSVLVEAVVADTLGQRPIFLASLDRLFYAAETLTETYCVFEAHNLYQIVDRSHDQAQTADCIDLD